MDFDGAAQEPRRPVRRVNGRPRSLGEEPIGGKSIIARSGVAPAGCIDGINAFLRMIDFVWLGGHRIFVA